MRRRKRTKLLEEIQSLNLVLSTFNLSTADRTKLQRRRLKRIEELARVESVQDKMKPWSFTRRKAG